MSGRIVMGFLTGSAMLAGLAAMTTGAAAADNAMKVCGAKYQAAKTAKTLPVGQSWQQYLASCRAGLGTPKPVAMAAPAAKPAMAKAPATAAPAAITAGRQAAIARERQCGAQWRADKAAGKTPAGQTWPQYWSKCNARMKG